MMTGLNKTQTAIHFTYYTLTFWSVVRKEEILLNDETNLSTHKHQLKVSTTYSSVEQ